MYITSKYDDIKYEVNRSLHVASFYFSPLERKFIIRQRHESSRDSANIGVYIINSGNTKNEQKVAG